jgi:hypothetical protein
MSSNVTNNRRPKTNKKTPDYFSLYYIDGGSNPAAKYAI